MSRFVKLMLAFLAIIVLLSATFSGVATFLIGSRVLAEANAPLRFAPGEGTGFFAKYGWNEAEFRSTWEESRRLKREMPMAWLFRLLARLASTQRREMFRRLGATVLLERHVVS